MATTDAGAAPPAADWKTWLRALIGRSPFTDPRSLLGSLLLHAALLAVASLVVLHASSAPPEPEPTARALRGELEGIDNRADEESVSGGGGDPSAVATDVAVERANPTAPTRDAAADALLSEVLPTRTNATPTAATLPGPSLADLGLAPGISAGSGGIGAGGGMGGGVGASVGPGTEFFGVRDKGGSYAYVIDRSGSMTVRHSLEVAKRELLVSLIQIPTEVTFAVVFYSSDATVFTDPGGKPGMMLASPANKRRVQDLLATIPPYGGTNHILALKTALALHPEVMFFLTDADSMRPEEVTDILAIAGKTRIHAVEFGQTGIIGGSAPLQSLAKKTGGSYRYLDVNSFQAY